MASITCPKCSARVEFEAGSKFVKCTYCGSQIYIDRSGAGFYYIIPFAVKENDAVGIFRRWAAGPKMAKNLDSMAQLASIKSQYFPVYMFKRNVQGKEEVRVEPAGSTTLPGLHNLKVPAGDLRMFDSQYEVGSVEIIKPDIEMLSYLGNLPGTPKEQALVYFPIWKLEYVFDQKRYGMIVDASSGEVFASEFPGRGSAAYVVVAAVGFGAFFGETLLTAAAPFLALTLMAATLVAVFVGSLLVAWRM